MFKNNNEHTCVSPGIFSKFACNFSRQHNFRSECYLGTLKTEAGMSESPPLNSSSGGGGHVVGGRGPERCGDGSGSRGRNFHVLINFFSTQVATFCNVMMMRSPLILSETQECSEQFYFPLFNWLNFGFN